MSEIHHPMHSESNENYELVETPKDYVAETASVIQETFTYPNGVLGSPWTGDLFDWTPGTPLPVVRSGMLAADGIERMPVFRMDARGGAVGFTFTEVGEEWNIYLFLVENLSTEELVNGYALSFVKVAGDPTVYSQIQTTPSYGGVDNGAVQDSYVVGDRIALDVSNGVYRVSRRERASDEPGFWEARIVGTDSQGGPPPPLIPGVALSGDVAIDDFRWGTSVSEEGWAPLPGGEPPRLLVQPRHTVKDPDAQTERRGVRLSDDHTRPGR